MRQFFMAAAFLLVATTAGAQNQASAPMNINGTYVGQAGQWNLKLTVNGSRGDLAMTCPSGDFPGLAVKVGADGKVDDYVKTGNGRRKVTGYVNGTLNVEPGGTCGGGTATMRKS
jgi:hypothetical protein